MVAKSIWTPTVTPESHPRLDWSPLHRHDFEPGEIDQIVIRQDPGTWFETEGFIIDKLQRLIHPRANSLQSRVFKVVVWCLEHDVPIRLFLLKPRQKGCSTVSMSVCYWMMRMFDRFRAVVIGREYSQSDNLWQIFRTYSNNDKFKWGFGSRVLQHVADMENGASLSKETAEDSEAGRSGTFHGVIATEAARWREKGVANAEEILNGLLNCVPYLPGTFVIQESTARGASGPFFDGWSDALDFEDFKRRFERGENLDGAYIRVFAGWHEFEDSYDELNDLQRASIQDTITPAETELLQKYNLDFGHIAWRRRTIRIECQRDEMKFDREFPETPEHAFRASAPSRFNTRGMAILKAESRQQEEKWGTLESQGRYSPTSKHFAFAPLPELDTEARIILMEPPRVGMRYLLAVDVMEGEPADDEGADLDHHRGLVLRDGYFDPDRGWRKPKVVAATVLEPKKGISCRWDIDILEEYCWRLSCFFGGCLVVPESNKDRGLIRGLVTRGANLYERQTDEERGDVREPKRSGKFGFRTTGGQAENTRNWILERLAWAVREWDQNGGGIEVDRRTAYEMENFIVDENGKAQAIIGEHDDSVMALAIGYALLPHATRLTVQRNRPPLPADLRETKRRPRGQYST